MRVGLGFLTWPLCVALAAVLVSCGSASQDVIGIAAIGEADDPFEKGIRLSPTGQMIRAATAEGLVSFDAQGRIVPALADRWIVTDDGRSYIFRLRDGTWRDGSPLTSRSALRALRNAVASLKGTSLGIDLSPIEDIRDMAGRVIEVRLVRPMPHFLQLMAQPELGLFYKNAGAGPMQLDKEDGTAILTPIEPSELGLPKVQDWDRKIRTIRLESMEGGQAVKRFNQGEADIVLGGTILEFPYTRSVGILRGTIQLDSVTGLFGLIVTHTDGFLSEAANREALAMAIDREALITPFGLAGWEPTTRLVPSGLDGDTGTIEERWKDRDIEGRRTQAAGRVKSWRNSQNDDGKPIELRIRLPEGPGANLFFKRIAGDFARIGIQSRQVGPDEVADLKLIDDVARYPRAQWFLNRLNCKVQAGPCSRKADELVEQANRSDNEVDHARLLAEAEVEMTLANIFIPIGAPVRWSLVRGDVAEFSKNRLGWHPLMPLGMPPK